MHKLKQYVKECCGHGSFKLTSGRRSSFYVNVKSLMFEPRPLALLGEELFMEIDRIFGVVGCVGGMELGSVPLTSAISMYSYAMGPKCQPLPHFVVRKAKREHGTGSQIEGVCTGDIILVDDVLTTGGSLVRTSNVLQEAGLTVKGAIVVVDREESQPMPFPIVSLFTKTQLRVQE